LSGCCKPPLQNVIFENTTVALNFVSSFQLSMLQHCGFHLISFSHPVIQFAQQQHYLVKTFNPYYTKQYIEWGKANQSLRVFSWLPQLYQIMAYMHSNEYPVPSSVAW